MTSSSDTLQAIYIRSFSQRSHPSPHIVYPVEVHALSSQRWTVWRRYSSFTDLDSDLYKETGASPPTPLPSKNTLSKLAFWSTSSSDFDESKLQERREGLERYLRSIITHRDPRWRNSRVFKEFIALPVGESHDHLRKKYTNSNNNGHNINDPAGTVKTDFTSSSWIDEHNSLQDLCREIRADLNKRDQQQTSSSPSDARQINVQAKKKLATLVSRTSILAKGLEDLGLKGMAQGELRRRADLTSSLQDEATALGNLASLTKTHQSLSSSPPPPSSSSSSSSFKSEANPQLRAQLLPNNSSSKPTPTKRFLGAGAKAQESDITRPLDNTGLVSLQQELFDNQDSRLESLSAVIRRQKEIGMAIGSELREQNELLEGLDKDVQHTETKLKRSGKEMRRLGGNK